MKIQEVIKTLEESSSNKQELIEFEAVDSGISQDLIKSVARDGTETEDNRGGGSNAPDRYYFYQSSDGQLIYANSFNVRCMIKVSEKMIFVSFLGFVRTCVFTSFLERLLMYWRTKTEVS